MQLNINISTNSSCHIVLEDITNYQSEDSWDIIGSSTFKKSDTAAFCIVEHKGSYGKILSHNRQENLTVPITFDGKFIVHYIVLPTKEWVENKYLPTVGTGSISSLKVYYTDGESFYKKGSTDEKVTIEEILNIDTSGTTISKINKEYVSICFLYKCYLNLCKQILSSQINTTCKKQLNISDLIYKRDLAWSAINVVKYLVEFRQLDEATRIIDQITQCNGICQNTTRSNYGCGCN